MIQPTVACVMLANGRPEMVMRAVESFRAQTYPAGLMVFDSGGGLEPCGIGAHVYAASLHQGKSIGALRNAANELCTGSDIICHWDSDDWSHPNRIAEQVALLQSSGAECVGYNEMLFWRESHHDYIDPFAPGAKSFVPTEMDPEAWLYCAGGCSALATNYAIGTSMCYWRKTWEQFPFPDYSPGCDDLYWSSGDEKKGRRAVKIEAVSGWGFNTMVQGEPHVPRMIAAIHGGNTCAKIDSTSRGGKEVWTRVPEWDAYCREAMKL